MSADKHTNKKRVLAADILGKTGWNMLEARTDIETIAFPNGIAQADFRLLLREYESVHAAILGLTHFGSAECNAAHDLQVVSRVGVGYDAIDVPTLTRLRIPVMIGVNSNSLTVAEHTLLLLLALSKRVIELNALVQEDRWGERMEYLPTELAGREVLLVGFGRIGKLVAIRCQAMGMTVSVYDPYVDAKPMAAANVHHATDLDVALGSADFISLHCPKTSETLGLFNAKRLARVKLGAFFVNTARGGIVDETALYEALSSGRLAGAALDVFLPEPPGTTNPLLTLPNVISSPHLAGVGRESVERMAYLAVSNVLSVLDGEPCRNNTINPEVFS